MILNGIKYILIAIDFMYKCVETVALPYNKEKSITIFFKQNIFLSLGMLRAIISD